MKQNFEASLAFVLRHEGGFVNHPKDPGGATNKGITLSTYRAYVNKNGTVSDLKGLTTAQAGTVYRAQYWNAVRGDELPSGVDYAVFDYAVNSGPSRAIKDLQKVLGVTADGQIGPQTLAAIRGANALKLIDDLCDRRMAFLRGLPTWGTFGKGWSSRVYGVRVEAPKMLGTGPAILRPECAIEVVAVPAPTSPVTAEKGSLLTRVIRILFSLIR